MAPDHSAGEWGGPLSDGRLDDETWCKVFADDFPHTMLLGRFDDHEVSLLP